MAYCVNCGVELEKSISHCPLCGIEARNPATPYDAGLPKPYSRHIAAAQQRAQRRVFAGVGTVTMLLAGVICLMADLVYNDHPTWSIFVLASLMLLWVTLLLPLLYKLHPAAVVLTDVCALLLFLYLVNLADTTREWYFEIAIPLVMLFGALGLIDVVAFRGKFLQGWEKYGLTVMSFGIAMLGLEAVLDQFNNLGVQLGWSWFVALPTFALGVILFLAERRRKLKDAIYKRLRL